MYLLCPGRHCEIYKLYERVEISDWLLSALNPIVRRANGIRDLREREKERERPRPLVHDADENVLLTVSPKL